MATLGNIGEKLDLLIKQGSTFGPFTAQLLNPDLTPVNLTGCQFRAQIRKTGLSPTIVATIPFTIITPLSGIYQFGLASDVAETIPAGETIKDPVSKYTWDAELVDSLGRVLPIYYGDCKVFREVTRA